MPAKPDFDTAAAHKYFAAHCFNRAWDLIEKQGRTAEDERLMVALNQASIYHWMQREDCDDRRLSVGYWQASRIQSVLGNAGEARRFAQTCLAYSRELEPFYLGYAFEALARAEAVAGNAAAAASLAAEAKAHAERVSRKEDRELLMNDLAAVELPSRTS